MAFRPYRDQEIRGYSSLLRSFFPEQFKTVPRTIVWSIIFFLDLTVVVLAGYYWGLLSSGNTKLNLFLCLAAVFGLFWLQGFVWYKFVKLFR